MRRPVIVLDPGHGGAHATGGSSPNNARGPNGLLEKDLTLDLARRAAGLLAADADVVLTRTGDSNLSLAERAGAARDRRADVFLSIHLNGFHDPAVDGSEVWTARSPSPGSRALARAVLERLLAVTGVADRGVREKNLGVLLASRHAPETAASLAEIAFLSNPPQARRLEDDGYRQRIAAALAEGVRQALQRAPAATHGLFEGLQARPAAETGTSAVYNGRPFTPVNDATLFRCAPTPAAVIPATLLPSPTADPDPAIREALGLAGLSAAQIAAFEKAGGLPGLRPFAEAFGGAALGEVMRRLRYTPQRFLSPPHDYAVDKKKGVDQLASILKVSHPAQLLPARLLFAIPGHFRELARRAPDEREAHALECFGWTLMKSVAGRVAAATGKRWWTPTPPPFVSHFPATLPQLSSQIQSLILKSMLIDTTIKLQDYLARFNAWSAGVAGRQWRFETGQAESSDGPGRPFYLQVLTVPPPFDVGPQRRQIDAAWERWLKEVDLKHPPATEGGREAARKVLIECHPERISGLKLTGEVSLGGLELTVRFPCFEPGPKDKVIRSSLTLLKAIKPTFELLFKTLYQLGWGDLVFQTQGAECFRGTKQGTNAAAARRISHHAYATAVDLMVFENPQGQETSTIDPRIVALFEAFSFRWGRCFSPPDPHHFEYCSGGCGPMPRGLEALAAGIGGCGSERLGDGGATALAGGAGSVEMDCPVLDSHGSRTRNAALRWNDSPAGGTMDVVVHLHGFVGRGKTFDLREKVKLSGCDLGSPDGSSVRSRATLGIIPRGKASGPSEDGTLDVYSFPALTDAKAGLDKLVRCGLDRFAKDELGKDAGSLQRGRLILTAHSGGGARLDLLLRHHDPHEIHFYDALYNAPVQAMQWARNHIQADAAALGSRPESEWPGYMRSEGGALRAVFFPYVSKKGGGTTPANTALHTAVECALQAIPNAGVQSFLRRYYRVESSAREHNEIPVTFGWQLLLDAGADLTPAPTALSRKVQCPRTARPHAHDEDDYDDGFGPQALGDKLEVCLRVPPPCIPARPDGAEKGPAFLRRIMALRGPKREDLILAELLKGNIPPFLRNLKPVTVKAKLPGGERTITYQVMPDYLSIGDDSDWVRIPINAITAQKVADRYCMILPTAKIAEDVYQNADIQLVGIARDYYRRATAEERAKQVATEAYLEHHEAIDKDLKSKPTYRQGLVVAGHKKDVVLADRLWTEKKLAFYGLYKDGKPTQHFKDGDRIILGKASLFHEPTFSDYSQGVRLVSRKVLVDGKEEKDMAEVLRDAELYPLVYNELSGPMKKPARIPGVQATSPGPPPP